jgi:hypothetical protein
MIRPHDGGRCTPAFSRAPQISPENPHGQRQRPTLAQRPRDAHTVCLRTVHGQTCETASPFAQQFVTRYTIQNRDQILYEIENEILDTRQKHNKQAST